MDGRRLEAIATRCVTCRQVLDARHRVLGAYRVSDLVYARHEIEVGFFSHGARPLWRHVDCLDTTLARWKMRPDIQYCIRCRKHLHTADIVQPVFGVENANAINPVDPTDRGLTLGERIYFVHVECANAKLTQGGGLLVTQ
jgi:hypothetical protein